MESLTKFLQACRERLEKATPVEDNGGIVVFDKVQFSVLHNEYGTSMNRTARSDIAKLCAIVEVYELAISNIEYLDVRQTQVTDAIDLAVTAREKAQAIAAGKE